MAEKKLINLANTAKNLAAYIRENFPVKGEPPPQSGGYDGGPGDTSYTLLFIKLTQVHFALLAIQDEYPEMPPTGLSIGEKPLVQRQATNKIRRGFNEVARCYGFDRLISGESVEERPLTEIDSAAVRCLEWGASQLLPHTKTEKTTKTAGTRGTQGKKTRKIDVAIVNVVRNPELDDAEIARQTGCNRSLLTKSKEYQRNADIARRALVRAQKQVVYDSRIKQTLAITTDPEIEC